MDTQDQFRGLSKPNAMVTIRDSSVFHERLQLERAQNNELSISEIFNRLTKALARLNPEEVSIDYKALVRTLKKGGRIESGALIRAHEEIIKHSREGAEGIILKFKERHPEDDWEVGRQGLLPIPTPESERRKREQKTDRMENAQILRDAINECIRGLKETGCDIENEAIFEDSLVKESKEWREQWNF